VSLSSADHIILEVSVPKGDVSFQYRHAGEISIVATAVTTDGKDLQANFFDASLKVEREGEHLKISATPTVTYAIPKPEDFLHDRCTRLD